MRKARVVIIFSLRFKLHKENFFESSDEARKYLTINATLQTVRGQVLTLIHEFFKEMELNELDYIDLLNCYACMCAIKRITN